MSHEIYNEDFELEHRKIIFSADYNSSPLDEAEETDEDCPNCGEKLYILSMQNGPDDFTEEYICKNCSYRETI